MADTSKTERQPVAPVPTVVPSDAPAREAACGAETTSDEYRSAAAELATSREELRSINEELQIVNEELRLSLDGVSRAHTDLQNLISATGIAILLLDTSLQIKMLTPRVSDIFDVTLGDVGRPVAGVTHRLDYPEFPADAQRVLADLIPIERMVRAEGNRWMLVRSRPCVDFDSKVDGVAVTIIDATERFRADMAWQARQDMLIGELAHRVKNTLSVVQSITQVSLGEAGIPPAAIAALQSRFQAMALAHALLVRSNWKGASLEALAREQLEAYGIDRTTLKGGSMILPPQLSIPVALMLHELAVHCLELGALRDPGGSVEIEWTSHFNGQHWLDLIWTEHGSQPAKPLSSASTTLIENCVVGGEVSFAYRPEGLRCSCRYPIHLPQTAC